VPQPAYGVVPFPPGGVQPAVDARQMERAAALVRQYAAPVDATEPAAELKARLRSLIRRLGSQRYSQRQAASTELIRIGPAALGALRAISDSGDLEVAARAWSAVAAIESRTRRPLVDRLKQLGLAAVMALNQQMSAAQGALAAAEEAASQAEWAGDAKSLAAARAARSAAGTRLRLLVRLSGQIALPTSIPVPKSGMATRYGIRPMVQMPLRRRG